MRVVALVSGGKDSTYNMMQVVAEGHEIVALANLHPKDRGKVDVECRNKTNKTKINKFIFIQPIIAN